MKISKATTAAYRALSKGDKSKIFVLMEFQGMGKRTIHRSIKREREISPLEWEMFSPVLAKFLAIEPALEPGPTASQTRIPAPTTLLARAKAYGKEARRKVQEYHDTKVA